MQVYADGNAKLSRPLYSLDQVRVLAIRIWLPGCNVDGPEADGDADRVETCAGDVVKVVSGDKGAAGSALRWSILAQTLGCRLKLFEEVGIRTTSAFPGGSCSRPCLDWHIDAIHRRHCYIGTPRVSSYAISPFYGAHCSQKLSRLFSIAF